jgi:hypothetical protein
VCGGITMLTCSWGDINTGTWPPSLGDSQFEMVKYGHEVLGPVKDPAGEAQQQLYTTD